MFASSLWIHKVDAVVLLVFSLLILLAGVICYAGLRSTSDFCVGRRSAGSLLSLLFGFGSGTNRDHGVSTVAGSMQQGAPGVFWQLLWLPVIPVFWLVAPLLRRLRTRTTADFFGARFGTPLATFYSAYAIGITVVVVAATLFSGGKLIDAVVGDSLEQVSDALKWDIPMIRLVRVVSPQQADDSADVVPSGRVFSIRSRRVEGYEYAVFGTAALILCCTVPGGMRSVLLTAAMQTLLILGVSAVLLPIILQSGGAESSLSTLEKVERLYSPTSGEPVGWFYVCVLCVTVLLGFIVQPHVVAVCRVGRTEMQSRVGLTAGNLLSRLLIVIWVGGGLVLMSASEPSRVARSSPAGQMLSDSQAVMAAVTPRSTAAISRNWSTPIPTPDDTAVSRLKRVLPLKTCGSLGFVVIAIMSMMMVICSGQLVLAGGMFAENLYKRVLNPGRTERHYLLMARVGTVLVLLAALVIQATFSSLITALRLVVMVPAAMGISMWFGLFWRRWNSAAVWVSVISSLATWFVTWMYPHNLIDFLPEVMFQQQNGSVALLESWQMLLYVGVGIVSGGLTSLATMPEYGPQVDLVFNALRTPVEPDEVCPFACVVPENNQQRDPVVEVGMWQFPVLTRVDIIGFFVSCVAVGLIALCAVLLS